jgi:bifunctional DNase/RNase
MPPRWRRKGRTASSWWIPRSSDALNLAVLVGAPVLVALEMLEDSDRRQEGDSAEAVLMRRALTACPMTINRAEQHRTVP